MRENLIPHGFLSHLHYPPQGFEERALKELYLEISEKHQYPQFELLADNKGAIFRQGERRSCEIYTDHLSLKEQPTQQTFGEHVEQVQQIVQGVRQRLGMHLFVIQQSILRFLIPFESPVAVLMKDQLFAIPESAYAQLKRPILGLCMRLEIPPTAEESNQIQVRIEPYFSDPKMMFLEMSVRYLQPLQLSVGYADHQSLPSDLKERFLWGHRYLTENLIGFLENSLGNPGGLGTGSN